MTLSGLGNRGKPSASWFCEPGRCVIVKLYPCNWINIRYSLGGADAMGLLIIITRGRWSVMKLKSRLNEYVWNRFIPDTIDKSSRLIQAYRCSVGIRLLLAYAMGLSSPSASGCRSAAPIPLKIASHCRCTGCAIPQNHSRSLKPLCISSIRSISSWNMCWLTESSNGSLRKEYRPNGVWNVVSF